MSAKNKNKPPHKNEKLRKLLMQKSVGLIEEAAKWAGSGDANWTLVYLRSAQSVVQACRELE